MKLKPWHALVVLSLFWLAAKCGTAENGEAAPTADAQLQEAKLQPAPAIEVAAAPPADEALTPKEPPYAVIPRPPKPGTPPSADAPSGGPCAADADCIPASCCHSKTCVDKAQEPKCEGMMCTMECRAGTMDCGGGKCVCENGSCKAVLDKPGWVKGVEGAIKQPQ